MTKIMQNLVVLIEPEIVNWITSSKSRNMLLNLFCIDEEAAFELTEIRYLKGPQQLFFFEQLDIVGLMFWGL